MVELALGFTVTLISLLIGYQLGKNQRVIPENTQKKINEIFHRVVPRSDVGPVERPSAQDNYYRDNPKAKIENEVMDDALGTLNNQ